MSDKDLIQEAIDYARRYWQHGSETRTQHALKVLADALEARLSVESLVCEPRQDSMLLWEGTSSASAPANEYDDAEESEAEYKNHAATVTSEPTDAQIEAGLKKVDWDAIRAGEADPEEAAGVAVRAALVAAGVARPAIDREMLIHAIAARHWDEDSGEVENWGELTTSEKQNVIDNYLCPRVADAVIAHLDADTEEKL